MNHFLHKHRYWFIALIALAVGLMIFYSLTDDDSNVPGAANPNTAPMPAAP